MVDIGLLESFLNEKSCKDGDMVEIVGEGNIEHKEDAITKRKYVVLNIPILLNGQNELIYSPNKDAVAVLQKEFGMKTEKWVGKKFVIKLYPKTSFGVTKNAILPVLIKTEKV